MYKAHFLFSLVSSLGIFKEAMRNSMTHLVGGSKLVSAYLTYPILASCLALSACEQESRSVNVYSERQEPFIKPLLERFTAQSGIEVNLLTAKGDALIVKIAQEGKNSPADVLITSDVARLTRAENAELLAMLPNNLYSQVPANARDAEHRWLGLTTRARVLVALKTAEADQLPDTYLKMADPVLGKGVCVRSSSNVYNQSLVAGLNARWGSSKTEQWAKGLVANMARAPQGGDRDQIRAVARGACRYALVNTYYLAAMLQDDKDASLASELKIIWPDQEGEGTHINISGIALIKNAPNEAAALELIDYLLSEKAQEWYADTNNEYPIKSSIKRSDVLEEFGVFKADNIALEEIGNGNEEAVKIMDRAGWR